MAKRKPVNTAESQVKAFVDAACGPPAVPAHVFLRDGDRPFWDGIVAARAREEWSSAALVVAAQLARCQADIEAESRVLAEEENTVAEKDDLLLVNPRLGVIEQLSRREMALMRTLRIGGAAAGDVRNEIVRRAAATAASQVREEVADDGLLAR
jgi:hypothetical protein